MGLIQAKNLHIYIQIKIEDASLLLQVKNKIIVHNSSSEKMGIGIENTRNRLELLYPHKYILTLHETPTDYEVYLKIIQEWPKRTIANVGSHNMRILDVDGDGDPDLFGANWSGPDQQILLWVNQTCSPAKGCPSWRRHVIDDKRPGKAVFIVPADIDGDGRVDIAAGGFWYRNPGRPDGNWERRAFGDPANDLVLLADLDGDRDTDAILTRWRESKADSRFVFAEYQGHGEFKLRTDLPAGAGDFLQGRALGHFSSASKLQLALSCHIAGKGIELMTIPPAPHEGRVENRKNLRFLPG